MALLSNHTWEKTMPVACRVLSNSHYLWSLCTSENTGMAVAQVHVRKGHLYHRLLKNIKRLCVFGVISIEKEKISRISKGPSSYFSKAYNLVQKGFLIAVTFSKTLFPNLFLNCIFISESILKEANLRFRICSYGTQLLWWISFPFTSLFCFYYSLFIWHCYMKKEQLRLFSLELFVHHILKLAP